jgi:hypothetical protein
MLKKKKTLRKFQGSSYNSCAYLAYQSRQGLLDPGK